jgi:CRP-like cAMP-binding protein
VLRGINLFSDCSKAELRRVASMTTEHSVKAGQVLVKQGEPGAEFFVIIEGRAAVIRNDSYLAARGPGSFVGELALLDRGKRSASVVAETDMRLLVMSVREFNSLRHVAPSVSHKMLVELGSSLRQSDDMIDGLFH